MKYHQIYGKLLKSELKLDLQETGFNYTFTDRNLFGPARTDTAFIAYTNITNQKNYIKRAQPFAKKIIIPISMIIVACFIGVVVSSTSVPLGSTYERYMNLGFYAGLFGVFAIYKLLGAQKVITVIENNGSLFTIFNDSQAEIILADIYKKRNEYLRQKFIDNNNYKSLSLESVEYLLSLGVIEGEEAQKFKEAIRSNPTGGMGFDKKE